MVQNMAKGSTEYNQVTRALKNSLVKLGILFFSLKSIVFYKLNF